MKKLFSILIMLAFVVGVTNAQENISQKEGTPKMTFKTKVIDYGVIEQGSERERIFSFTNTGNSDLIIKNAKGSCGCTVPQWPKKPIAPGAAGQIKVNYDTNRLGKFTKTVRLTTNETRIVERNGVKSEQPVTTILTIKGEVKPKQSGEPKNSNNSILDSSK